MPAAFRPANPDGSLTPIFIRSLNTRAAGPDLTTLQPSCRVRVFWSSLIGRHLRYGLPEAPEAYGQNG